MYRFKRGTAYLCFFPDRQLAFRSRPRNSEKSAGRYQSLHKRDSYVRHCRDTAARALTDGRVSVEGDVRAATLDGGWRDIT